MKPTDRTQERTQKTGAYAALGVAGVFVLVVAYFVIFGGGGGQGNGKGPHAPKAGDVRPLGQGATNAQGVGPVTDFRFDLTDKKDPNKRTGLLVFAAMDPLEGHRYSVDKPQAWRFLDDGRCVYIRADSGLIYRPEGQQQPESGTIRGRVEIKLFAKGVDVQKFDPAAPSLAVIRTESLAFEAAVGELSTPDFFAAVWEGGTFEGTGLSLVFDQPREKLVRGEVQRNGKLTLSQTPKKNSPAKADETKSPAEPGPARASNTPAGPVEVPIESLYRLIGSGKVAASQGPRRLTADKFQVLARLLDNRLPEGAIGQVKFAQSAAKPAPTSPAPANPAPGDASAPGGQGLAAPAKPGEEPLVLAWEGPCVISSITEAPVELKNDHLAANFTADSGSKITLADGERGITGFAEAIEYAATSRGLSLIGKDAGSVSLAVPESGRIVTQRIDADLVNGIIRTPRAGTLASGDAEKPDQQLSWSDRGEFAFLTTEQGLTGSLKEAIVVGNVRGDGKGMTFTSGTARATFAEVSPEQKKPVLASVDLSGGAVAQSVDTGMMSAQKIHVDFEPPTAKSGDDQPIRARFVRAEENFIVEREGQRLSGQYLESVLFDAGDGKMDVGSVLARGGVTFKSEKDFITGQTEELRADLGLDENGQRKQLVNLVGEGTFVSRDEPGREQGKVTGTQLAIDGIRGRMESFGVGNFAYKGLTGAEPSAIDATWTRRMVYDDSAGLIDCWGNSKANYSPDANTRNKVDAERIKLFMTPGTPGRSILGSTLGGGEKDSGAAGQDRSVLGAEAHGSIQDREGGTNARIESRTYAAGVLQKLSYIEGPSVLASNDKGTIDVPGAGKFLLVDQSAATGVANTAPGARDLGGDTRGTSLFEWATSLHAEKNGGAGGDTVMTMKDRVNVVHRALRDGQVTEIRCDDIVANLKDKAGSLGEAGRGLELQSVAATGSVYAASGPPKTDTQPRPPLRELISHSLEYDAINRRIEAKAQKGGVVTMFDPSAASPTTASWLTWDLEKNSVQVRQPAGAAPR